MTLEDAKSKINETIAFKLKHRHYERTLAIKRFCFQIMTGKEQDEFIEQVRYKERESAKKHRKDVTISMTSVAVNPIAKVYKRVFGVDNITATRFHDDVNLLERVERALSKYHAGESMANYLRQRLLWFNLNDPNAFILTERENVEGSGTIDDIIVYPAEIHSEQAINYEIERGSLRWLIVEHKRKERLLSLEGDGASMAAEIELSDFYMYFAGYVLKYTEVQESSSEALTIPTIGGNPRYFIVEEYPNGTTEVPARKAGVIVDPEKGDSSVFVPLYWPAKPVLLDLIRDKSLFDVNKIEQVYRKLFTYGPECTWADEKGNRCRDGYLNGIRDEEHKCPQCKGTGIVSHVSEQDVMTFKLRNGMTNEEIIDLSRLIHETTPEIETAKFFAERLLRGRKDVFMAIFNAENVEQPLNPMTATEVVVNDQELNDTVREFGDEYSAHWELHGRVAFQYYNGEGATVKHIIPRDLKLKDIATLTKEYEDGKKAGLSYDILWEIQCDILRKKFKNEPNKVEEIKAFEKHRPFRSLESAIISGILAGRDKMDHDRVLYENFDWVVDQVKARLNGNPFHKLSPERQKLLLVEAVEEKRNEISLPQPASVPMPDLIGADAA